MKAEVGLSKRIRVQKKGYREPIIMPLSQRDFSVSFNVWKVNHAPPKGHIQELIVITNYRKKLYYYCIAVFFVFFYGGYKGRYIKKV